MCPIFAPTAGGPGAGKGTQCELIVNKYGYTHISAGDCLRAERASGSKFAELINDCIRDGKIVPVEITVKLLLKAMEESGKSKFLIDGAWTLCSCDPHSSCRTYVECLLMCVNVEYWLSCWTILCRKLTS